MTNSAASRKYVVAERFGPPVAWAVVIVILAMAASGFIFLATGPTGTPPDRFGSRWGALNFSIGFGFVGWMIATRRPGNPIGWLFLASAVFAGGDWVGSEYAIYSLLASPGALPKGEIGAWFADWLYIPFMASGLAALPLLFPDGSLRARWERFVLAGTALAAVLGVAGTAFIPGAMEESSFATNPFPVESSFLTSLGYVGFALLLLTTTLGLVSLFLRFRHGNDLVRQQVKWLVSAILVYVVSLIVASATSGTRVSEAAQMATEIAILAVPVATAIAILRYRLYEIDFLINRALVYGPLTGLVAGTYVSAVALSRAVFVDLTGTASDTVVILTTLVAAAVFWLVRMRLVAFVDRHFKDPAEPSKAMLAFTQRMTSVAEVVEPGALSVDRIARLLLSNAMAAFDARGGSVELHPRARTAVTHEAGEWAGDGAVSTSISWDGVEIGRLHLGSKSNRRPYTDRDRRILASSAESIAALFA